jgi:Domain of unknown function (DUF309)
LSETRLRFLVRFLPPADGREAALADYRILAHTLGLDLRNPKWTSYGALEVDLFAGSRSDLQVFLAAAEPLGRVEFHRDLNLPQHHLAPRETVDSARELFDAERYWEAHEVLEGLWRTLSGDEKAFVQGVILVCAAFVHHQKGEDEVAKGVLRRALRQLHLPEEYLGLDPARIANAAERILSDGRFRPFRL